MFVSGVPCWLAERLLAERCLLCVSDHREVCLAEGHLAVELNFESVVLLLVCVTMMMMIIMMIIMRSPVRWSI